MITPVEATKHGIERYELGEYIHAAMRKVCFTPPTTLAWYLISTYMHEPRVLQHVWGTYLDRVWAKFDAYTPDNVADLLVLAATDPEPTHESMALSLTLRAFSRDDWASVASMLAYAMRAAAEDELYQDPLDNGITYLELHPEEDTLAARGEAQ